MSDQDQDNPRREFLRKSLTLIPVVTVASTGLGGSMLMAVPEPAQASPEKAPVSSKAYEPSYFTAEEWAFINAAVARLIPADDQGPGALEAGAPEYIDRQMNTPYAAGALWFMQGPFNADAPPEMGWQSKLVPKEIYRLGIAATDAWSKAMNGKLLPSKTALPRKSCCSAWRPATRSSTASRRRFSSICCCKTPRKGFLRPGPRWQQRHGRLDHDRLPRRPRRFHGLG